MAEAPGSRRGLFLADFPWTSGLRRKKPKKNQAGR
jgi:hypothetical protein